MSEITSHELDVLEMMAGRREGEWGAWVSACLEYLSGFGLCTRGPRYTITDKGRAVLDQHRPLEHLSDGMEAPGA